MIAVARRAGTMILVGLVTMLGMIAGPSARYLGPAAAQMQPVIESAALFTFPGDWSAIPDSTVTLFFPGQASWQFVTSSDHPGGEAVAAGTTCRTCHAGQERALGERLVKHPRLEPAPVAGKRGSLDVSVRAAFDAEYLYLRFEWQAAQPGASHTLWRYDGTRWVAWGGPLPDAARAGIPPSYEERLAVMFTERNVPAADGAKTGFNQAGCFIACHNSLRNMPRDVRGAPVQGHPYFGTGGMNASDMRHYLLLTRTGVDETGGWDKVKTRQEIERLKAEGSFLDLWQWRAYRSNPVGYAGDDYILEYRLADGGRSPFTTPAQPSVMYDQAKTGFRAVPESRFGELLPRLPLIAGLNAVPLDPAVRFTAGDILPQNVLRAPDGSSADVLANGAWRNGRWVVELRRKLVTGNADDKPLTAGRVYRFGLAVFNDKVSNRYHFVSFPQTLGLGRQTVATVRAVRLGR